MQMLRTLLALAAATTCSAAAHPGNLLRFSLTESPDQLRRLFGEAPDVIKTARYTVLRFGHDHAEGCTGDYAYSFFYDSNGRLLTVTYAHPVSRQRLFPGAVPIQHEGATYYVRNLDARRVLVSVTATPERPQLDQTVLLERTQLGRFFPSLPMPAPSSRRP